MDGRAGTLTSISSALARLWDVAMFAAAGPVAQAAVQLLPAAKEPRFYSDDVDIEGARRVAERLLLKSAEFYSCARHHGEGLDLRVKEFFHFPARAGFFGAGTGVSEFERGLFIIFRFERPDGDMDAAAAVSEPLARSISDDGPEPGGDLRVSAKLLQVPPCAEQALLHDVFRIFTAPGDALNIPQKLRPPFAGHVREEGQIWSGARFLHGLSFRIARGTVRY